MSLIANRRLAGASTTMIRAALSCCAATIALSPVAAWAHPGAASHTHGFEYGFAHPFSGIDHVFAMVSVGLFATRQGGRALWLLPLTFISIMGLAGVAGMTGIALPLVEIGIGLSVVVLGLVVASRQRLPTAVAMALVGLFAVFHGYAHGIEMPASSSGLLYGLGFVMATAVLHAMGIGVGLATGKIGQVRSLRVIQISGAAISLAGAAILLVS